MTKRIVLLQALAATPDDLTRMLKGVKNDSLHQRLSEKEWSIGDVVDHLIYVEVRYQDRLRKVVDEDRPELSYIRPNEDAHDRDAGAETLRERFKLEREKTLDYLRSLSHGDWQRPAVHEIWGDTNVRYLVQSMVDHDTEHLNQMVEIQSKLQVVPYHDPQPASPAPEQ